MTSETPSGGVRERILEAAADLFYRRGINNVGVDEIVAHSGVSKMSLYKHFGSKDALARAYVEHWGSRWLQDLRDWVHSRASDPRERILYVFDALGHNFEQEDFRGCAFINGAIEVADHSHPVHEACVRDQQRLRAFMLELATDAGAGDPEELSRQLSVLFNGAVISALLQDGPAAADAARQAATVLLDAG